MSSVIDLDAAATQSGFADLVGCTKQAINKRVEKGLLSRGGTYREWLKVYIDDLRSEAAGRGGDAQKTLTEQRIEESTEKTLALRLANLKEMGILAPAEEFVVAASVFAREVNGAISELGSVVKAKFRSQFEDLEFEDDLIDEPVRSASRRVAKNAEKLGEDFLAGGGGY